jgi:CO/xanthine dehydrogenase Mo-binding subunit/aerobic-type carbon monoxide dehydrogenase small subunit (CoxS/CutS family)
MRSPAQQVAFTLNGRRVEVHVDPVRRLADVLREDLGLTGTKVGCNAGDCGACTVRLDGRQVCACMVAAAQVQDRQVVTVEGLANGETSLLQQAFLAHGAAQCGICTPGMLMAADDLLARNPSPTEAQVMDALGGVLCRCTGYRKIVEAVLAVASRLHRQPASFDKLRMRENLSGMKKDPHPELVEGRRLPIPAVGARLTRVDGEVKVLGTELYGADQWPADCLVLRAIRSPHAHARFTLGDLRPLHTKYPGLVRILVANDIPGQNRYGIYPTGKDQPALAESYVRHRGEAVLALVGDDATIASIRDNELPITWEPLPPLSLDAALAAGAAQLHDAAPGNILIKGRVARGDVEAALRTSAATAEITVETSFVEHAYIEPEAGCARRVGDRIEIFATTQTPYMDRDEIALILGLKPEQVRIIPSACGGGFGGKLDLSLQPLIATAAWLLDQPVRCVYTRPESMMSTTKRHPARMAATFGADANGLLRGVRFHGDFNTGAYASWGPTVANRVPVHAMGPYAVQAALCTTRAIYTNDPPAGAFRGFGVPQAAIVHEALMDALAEMLGIDPLEIRHRNALKRGSVTATGQKLDASAGLQACLESLRPHWRQMRAEAEAFNRSSPVLKRGAGVGAMWYGIGNTSMSNPSTMEIGITGDGQVILFSGALDIGQGSNTVMAQIAADALGVPVDQIQLVIGDTDRTRDAGKTSASRQTFVSGNAARLAGEGLRRQILRLGNVGDDAAIRIDGRRIHLKDGTGERTLDLSRMADVAKGCVLLGTGRYDPKTTALDADGQGIPYETYAFAAQLAAVEVDTELGTVRVRRIVAAHDVGRSINPTLVEGQIHGGIAQGLGLALMEEYVPGRTENLHDYLIPTFGDVPEIECILIEDHEPAGPYGAKGIGEPALVPTAPAIVGAIHHATGIRITHVPATPDRIRAAIKLRRT